MIDIRYRNLCVLLCLALGAATAVAADLLVAQRPLPLRSFELETAVPGAIADRRVYWNDDLVGQFVICFGHEQTGDACTVAVVDDATTHWSAELTALTAPRLSLRLRVNELPPGNYRLRATMGEVTVARAFERADRSYPVRPIPAAGIPLEVQPQSHLANGVWPICAGVPLPPGTLFATDELVLLEDGEPVPAQLDVVSTWHPADNGITPSIRWLHLKFLARYRDGQPCRYALAAGAGPKPANAARAELTDDGITIDTGVVRVQLRRHGFAGIAAAWSDLNRDGKYGAAEQVIFPDPPAGPYLIDQRAIRFAAANDDGATIEIEEGGPLRVVVHASGWYVNPDLSDQAGQRLCRFNTRLIAWAGQPSIEVQHHTTITYDANTQRLRDVGFGFSLPLAKTWRTGLDGTSTGGELPPAGSVFAHQYRWNEVRVRAAPDDQGTPVETKGQRSDGWLTVGIEAPKAAAPQGEIAEELDLGLGEDLALQQPAVTVMLRDIWQKFPKELEAGEGRLTLHFWPAHGLRTFTEQELYGRAEIYKLRWFHHGALMDLRLPSAAFDSLLTYDADEHWDPEGMKTAALSGNAQGVTIGNSFMLYFGEADSKDAAALAQVFQAQPHARPDPAWTAATGVLGRLTARDAQRFPEAEHDLDTANTAYLDTIVDGTAEYGMWIYADEHNHWQPDLRQALLHRVWQAGHYQQVWTPWMLYLRGAPFAILRWARANSDHFRDISTIGYADPEHPIKFHAAGAMYHAKGFVPWGSAAYGAKYGDSKTGNMSHAGVQNHFINPDAFLLRYFVEGDLRALDMYRLWAEAITSHGVWQGASREINNTLGETLELYRATWDPLVLEAVQTQAESMLALPMTEMPSPYHHPVWHLAWFSRLFDLTRDERVVASLRQYTDVYRAHPWSMTFMYWQTKDKSYLEPFIGGLYDRTRAIYANPGDPVDGYRPGFPATGAWYYRSLPYLLAALSDSGVTALTPGSTRSVYPSHGTHPQFLASEGPALLLLALAPEDRAFQLRLEALGGRDHYHPLMHAIAPSGKIVAKLPARDGQTRYVGDNIVTVPIPADGEHGLYQFDFRSWGGIPFLAPLTDLPVEGISLPKGRALRTAGRFSGYLLPVGEQPRVELTWTAERQYDKSHVAYIRVEDGDGKALLETTLLFGAQRQTAALTLDAASQTAPFHVYTYCAYGPTVSWTGDARALVSAPTADMVQQLATALRSAE